MISVIYQQIQRNITMEIQIKCTDETNIGLLNLTLTTKHKGITIYTNPITNNHILSSDFGNQIHIDIILTPKDITNIISILSPIIKK